MRHVKMKQWDDQLKSLFDEIDDVLEDKYGKRFVLHPNRMRRGTTSNKEMDGLFNIGASFSAGYGSEHGRGYVVQVRMSTLEHVPSEFRNTIHAEVEELVKKKLPEKFPGRRLALERDGNLLKIIGDFSLGSVSGL